MICNITKGNGFYECVDYVLGGDARLVSTNMSGDSPTELAWEFRLVSNKNERVHKPVLHISFNPEPDDRPLNDLEYSMITRDLLDGLKLENNQFLLVEHRDTKVNGKVRPHCHIVINRVDMYGKCNDDFHDYYRAQRILRQIEKDYKLIECPSSWEIEEKKGPPLRQDETKYIQEAIKEAASDKPEMPVFIKRLQDNNIDVQCRITRTGKLQGISYSYNDKAFKGRQLGKDYTYQGIQSKLGVIHKSSHKKQIELLINAPRGDNSDTATESTTDNTSVVESTQKNFVSVVPSIEATFGTEEDNKAKKQLNNKAKSNKLLSKNEVSMEAITPERPTYKSVVPQAEAIFPIPKDTFDEKNSVSEPSNADTRVETSRKNVESIVHRIEEPKPETAKPTPEAEPEAVKLAVKIAGYMGSTNQTKIEGDSMKANLSFNDNISTLEVRRIDTNEVILSANHTISGDWVITDSKKFTDKEKKRIDQLKERTNVPMQQPVNEKKGFEQ